MGNKEDKGRVDGRPIGNTDNSKRGRDVWARNLSEDLDTDASRKDKK